MTRLDESFSTLGVRNPTSASNLSSIGGVNKVLEIGVFDVLAKARLLFSDLSAAQFRRGRR